MSKNNIDKMREQIENILATVLAKGFVLGLDDDWESAPDLSDTVDEIIFIIRNYDVS
jgi:hypothetical protein